MVRGSRWYVVQTQPGREAYAVEQLRRQSFSVFFPRRRKMVRHARRIEERAASYFPGYAFVALDLGSTPWRAINGTYGVRSLVMAGDQPAAVPQGFVEGLRALADSNDFIEAEKAFARGDRVSIASGPFAELVGTVDRLEGASRVRILIDLLNGVAPFVAARSDVVLAS